MPAARARVAHSRTQVPVVVPGFTQPEYVTLLADADELDGVDGCCEDGLAVDGLDGCVDGLGVEGCCVEGVAPPGDAGRSGVGVWAPTIATAHIIAGINVSERTM